MIDGLKVVLVLFCITLLISIPLGIAIAFCRISKNKFINKFILI